jgi:hypothetical protein
VETVNRLLWEAMVIADWDVLHPILVSLKEKRDFTWVPLASSGFHYSPFASAMLGQGHY